MGSDLVHPCRFMLPWITDGGANRTCVFVRPQVDESDLRQVFSARGAVKEVKIVTNHSGMPMG